MFRDGNINFEKIMKTAVIDGRTYQIKKKKKEEEESEDHEEVTRRIEFVFVKWLAQIKYHNDFPLSRYKHHEEGKEFDSPHLNKEASYEDDI